MKHKLLRLQSLVAVAMCVVMAIAFTSCGDDDDEEPTTDIVGTWICTQTTNDENGEDMGFAIGDGFKLFASGKAFILYDGYAYVEGVGDVADPSESQWDKEEGDTWKLSGNQLTVMESDLDRYIGTIAVNGNELTFTYKYQNWNYDSGTMTEESKETYVSKFQKK